MAIPSGGTLARGCKSARGVRYTSSDGTGDDGRPTRPTVGGEPRAHRGCQRGDDGACLVVIDGAAQEPGRGRPAQTRGPRLAIPAVGYHSHGGAGWWGPRGMGRPTVRNVLGFPTTFRMFPNDLLDRREIIAG